MSGAGISYFSSQQLLSTELAKIRAKSLARIQPQAESGGALLSDSAFMDDAQPALSDPIPNEPDRTPIQPAGRTRRDAHGEVEGEAQMWDTYSRPGIPRSDV